ncbi:MAG: lipoprotein [Gracilibacteraceae bacterium]|nr:lipoprotein [Gracilibacteraceae bacterium]
MKRILSAILIVMLLAGCSQKPAEPVETVKPAVQPAAEQNTEAESPIAAKKEESNLFDARMVKEGDLVAGLKIIKVQVDSPEVEDYDAYVDFEGEVTVSGTFKHNLNDEFLDHEISFKVDEESEALLPKLAHDQRYAWFMFMNHDEAEKALGAAGTEGKAAVTIKNYSINYAHTEIWNTAELVKAEIFSTEVPD